MAGEVLSLLPQGGVAAGVLALFGWYTKTSRDDRKEYRDDLKARTAEFEERLAEAKAEFDKRLADEHARLLETEMAAEHETTELRRRLADMETVVMGERASRRDAELDLEGAKIRLEHARMRVRLLKGEEVEMDV